MASTILDFLKTKSTPTTERGAERATSILLEAQNIVIEEGFAALSMRGLAGRVGITLGNLQHYYASKEQLLSALVLFVMDHLQSKMAEALLKEAGSTPRKRLEDSVKVLLTEVQDPRMAAVFMEIWTLSGRAGFAGEVVSQVQARELKAMKQLLKDLPGAKVPTGVDTRAAMMVLLIEGLTVQLYRAGTSEASRQALVAAAHRTIVRVAYEGA